jgi:hypothetical protein
VFLTTVKHQYHHPHIHTMKLTAICLFSAIYAAAYTLASDLQPTIPSISNEAAPEPTGLTAEEHAALQ